MKLVKRTLNFTDAVSAVGKTVRGDEVLEALLRAEKELDEFRSLIESQREQSTMLLNQLIDRESVIEDLNTKVENLEEINDLLLKSNNLLSSNLQKLQPRVRLKRLTKIPEKSKSVSCQDKQIQVNTGLVCMNCFTSKPSKSKPTSKSVLNNNQLHISSNSEIPNMKFICSTCHKPHDNYKLLRRHMLEKHACDSILSWAQISKTSDVKSRKTVSFLLVKRYPSFSQNTL